MIPLPFPIPNCPFQNEGQIPVKFTFFNEI